MSPDSGRIRDRLDVDYYVDPVGATVPRAGFEPGKCPCVRRSSAV